jgi:hypothetical protein
MTRMGVGEAASWSGKCARAFTAAVGKWLNHHVGGWIISGAQQTT